MRRVLLIACLVALSACAPKPQPATADPQTALGALAVDAPSSAAKAQEYWILRWFLLLTFPFI